MTEHDVKNYLEKIYKIPVVELQTTIRAGKFPMAPSRKFLGHEPDYRLCFVTMPEDYKFTHPHQDLFLRDGKNSDELEFERVTADLNKKKEERKKETQDRQGIPTWFTY